MLCSYSEVLGFRGMSTSLSETTSPLHLLAARAGMPFLGPWLDAGSMISMFACVLACATAAARVLLRMSRSGLLPVALGRTSAKHATPSAAILLSCGLMFVGTAAMAIDGVNGFEMYDFAGSLCVLGFLTAYALVAVAVPMATARAGSSRLGLVVLSAATVSAMVLITLFDLRSTADAVHARIPFLYLAYLGAGLVVFFMTRSRARAALEAVPEPES